MSLRKKTVAVYRRAAYAMMGVAVLYLALSLD